MNGRERIALAMQHKAPDRVPVMCQLALGHYFLNTDIPPHKIWFTSEGFAEALIQLQRRYHFDGILINLPGRPADFLDDLVSVEETREGELLTWANGDKTLVPWDDNPIHMPAGDMGLPRADFEQIDPENLDGLDDITGYVWNIYHVPWIAGKEKPGPLAEVPPYFYRTIDLVKEKSQGEVSIHGEVFSPFTHFMEMIGYENALLALLEDPAKAHALLERFTTAAITWGVAQAKHGVDAVLISSAFAGGPLLSPRMYEQFVLPYEKQLVEAVKATGTVVYTHTCGSIGDRLDLMVQTGTMGIDTLDPPPLGNSDLETAKSQIGDRVFIKGNMNAVALLQYKEKEDVIAHATDRILVGKPGGGYILSTACSVSPKMQPWKLELLTPLSDDIGQYS